MEEAKARISAGELAFRLRRYEEVIVHLERYFELVDNYNCDPEVTSVALPNHLTSVANLAEAFWQMKKYSEAVHWATRELTSYGDDVAGQAQAWCNLGVYLSDYGKKEEALEALNRSVELAHVAGDLDIAKKAECNIDILTTESEKSPSAALAMNSVPDAITGIPAAIRNRAGEQELGASAAAELPRFSARAEASILGPLNAKSPSQPHNSTSRPQTHNATSPSQPAAGSNVIDLTGDDENAGYVMSRENSIVILSGNPSNNQRCSQHPPVFGSDFASTPNRRRDVNATSSAAYSYSKPREPRENMSRSNFSRGCSGADRSSAGSRKYVDVASIYKKLCASDSRRKTTARQGILEVLRAASASVLTSIDVENGTECVHIDLQGSFMGDSELPYLFQALAAFGNFKPIAFDLSYNPLLSDTGYRCFVGDARMSSCANIRVLNLSCAGVDGKALQLIAEAMRPGQGLAHVKDLSLSKNALGRHPVLCVEACATLFTAASSLESVDLSFNLLSSAFFTQLVNSIQLKKSANAGTIHRSSTLQHVDLKLNNRRNPTAMLEFDKSGDAVECVAQLTRLMPTLQSIDVRSCGAPFSVRKALYAFVRGANVSDKILIVSPGVFDEAAL